MIVAIVNQHGHADRATVARNLAVLRARSGRKVCLVAADTPRGAAGWCTERSTAGVQPWIGTRTVNSRSVKEKLAALRPLFNDILLDAGARDTPACNCILTAARLVVVPVHGAAIDLASQYALLARIKAARAFNPGLRVLFVMVTEPGEPAAHELAAVLAHVARVEGASLAATVLHAPSAHEYGAGRCVCDAATCDPELAAEMQALYDEVYGAHELALEPRRTGT